VNKENNNARILLVLSLINIKLAKAFFTLSNGAFCVVKGMMPINIRIEDSRGLNQLNKSKSKINTLFDKNMEVRFWQYRAETGIRMTDEKEETGSLHL